MFGVLVKALNRAYDVEEPYSFLKRILVEFILALTIGLLFIIALVSRSVFRYLSSQKTNLIPGQQDFLFGLLQDLVPAVLLFVVFFLIYRFVPKAQIDTRAALTGASIALALFLIARPLFLRYLSTIANYNLIYGSLAIVVILMIWTWMISIIVLFGGEITSKVQKVMIENSS